MVPGFGAGYLHQRRWKGYWIKSALPRPPSSFVGGVLGQRAEGTDEMIGFNGLVPLAAGPAVDVGLAAKKCCEQN